MNGFILDTVIRCFSCPVDFIGTIFDPCISTVVSLGISAQMGVSSMFAMFDSEKPQSRLWFSQNLTKLAIFCRASLGIVCPVVVHLHTVRLFRLIKLKSHPRLA